jgi:hypothetical protein
MFVEGPDYIPDTLNYMDCPECGGPKKMLVVNDADGLYYKCFKVTCATSGRGSGTRAPGAKADDRPKRNTYERQATRALEQTDYNTLTRKWDLVTQEVRVLCSGITYWKGSRWVFPIYDYAGRVRGETIRAQDKEQPGPKAIVHPFNQAGSLSSWYFTNSPGSGVCVVVEDQPSAVRMSRHHLAISLQGTKLTKETADEIRKHVPKGYTVLVCLDADATAPCIKMAKELRGHQLDAIPFPLRGPDIKDMTREQFEKFLGEVEYICG